MIHCSMEQFLQGIGLLKIFGLQFSAACPPVIVALLARLACAVLVWCSQ